MSTTGRRNLVIVRAGNGSLHPGWIAGGRRDFDLFISYFGTETDKFRDDADHYEMRRGPKWSCIADLLAEQPALLEAYDAFWFPDDDLAADTDTLNRMFGLFHGFGLALAQPALTEDSYHSYNTLLRQDGVVLRYVGFVEVMAPIFSREALVRCLDTFAESRSGWGIDWIWPGRIEQDRADAIAVLDATPVTHTRPLGGELYKNNPEMNPRHEADRVIRKHGLERDRAERKYQLHGVVRRTAPSWWQRLSLTVRRWSSLVRARR